MHTVIFAVLMGGLFFGLTIFSQRLRGNHICRPERIRAKLMGYYYL